MCKSDLRRNSPPRPNQFSGIEEERILSNGKGDQLVEEKKKYKRRNGSWKEGEKKKKKRKKMKIKERKRRRKGGGPTALLPFSGI